MQASQGRCRLVRGHSSIAHIASIEHSLRACTRRYDNCINWAAYNPTDALNSKCSHAVTELSKVPGWRIIAVDQARETLDVAGEAFEKVKHAYPDAEVEFVHANITRAPLDESVADAVLLFNVLEENPSLRAIMREVRNSVIFRVRLGNSTSPTWLQGPLDVLSGQGAKTPLGAKITPATTDAGLYFI
jgi:hypothetical protein